MGISRLLSTLINANKTSKKSPRQEPRRSPLHLEPLEDRTVPAFVGRFFFGSEFSPLTVSFTETTPGNDLLVFSQDENGLLMHNRFDAGDPGFESPLDMDSTIQGVQSVRADAVDLLLIDGGVGQDTVTLNVTFADTSAVDIQLAQGLGTINLNVPVGSDTLSGNGAIVNVASGAVIQEGIELAGTNATVNAAAGTFIEAVDIDVEGLTLNGQGVGATTVTAGSTGIGITIRADDVTVQNLTVQDSTTGIFSPGANLTLQNVQSRNNLGDGLFATGFGTINVLDSSFLTNGGAGIEFEAAGDVVLTNVTATANASNGLSVDISPRISIGANSISIMGGNFSGNIEDGLYLNAITSGVAITGAATVTNNLSRGVEVINTPSLTISDAIITGNSENTLVVDVTTFNLDTDTGSAADIVDVNTTSIGGDGFLRHDRAGTLQNLYEYSGVTTLGVDFFAGNDIVNVNPHPTTSIDLDGGTPTAFPGDVFNLEPPSTSAVTLALTASNSGTFSFGSGDANVTYTNFEYIDSLGGQYTITSAAVGDGNNDIEVSQVSSDMVVDVDGGQFFRGDINDIIELTIDGQDGADVLTVNVPSGILTDWPLINFNGDAGIDGLVFTGGDASNPIVRETYVVGVTEDAGLYVLDQDGNAGSGLGLDASGDEIVVNFTGLEPIDSDVPATDYDIILNALANQATLQNGGVLGDADALQLTDNNGTFETVRFTNKTNVDIMGNSGADTITVAYTGASTGLTTLDLYGHLAFPVVNGGGDDGASDEFQMNSNSAGLTPNAFGQGGSDLFHNTDNTLNDLLGGFVLIGGETLNDLDQVNLSDSGDTTGDNVTLTLTTLTGTGADSITYSEIEVFEYDSTSGADAISITSTDVATNSLINGNAGSDTFTIGNQTSDFNVTFDGSLDAIAGPLAILPNSGDDVLNFDDSGSLGLNGSASISLTQGFTFDRGPFFGSVTGDVTELVNFGPAPIRYFHASVTGTIDNSLEFLNGLLSQGSDTLTIDVTTATNSTTLNGREGDDLFLIDGDDLSADNTIQGFDGSDSFTLNISSNIGEVGLFDILGLTIEGQGQTVSPTSDNRDQITINDSSNVVRNLNYDYTDTPGVDVAPFVAGGGLFGTSGGGNLSLQVRTTETLIYNDVSEDNDVVRVTGTSVDDDLTVALLASNNSALVFHGGTPYTSSPPVELVNGVNFPGVRGGGTGPDLLINGIDPTTGLTLDGSGNAGVNGTGNRAIVYAASEEDLLTGGTFDVFGFGPGVLIPGFGTDNAYDIIDVNGATPNQVAVINNSAQALLPVNIVPSSFVQNGNPSPTQRPGLIVNGGDEVTAQSNGIADDFTVASSSSFNIQVNGNLPVLLTGADSLPIGDQLNLSSPTSINIFSDKSQPPNVTVTYGNDVFGILSSSIERTFLTPGNGVMNLIGDNNDPTVDQTDNFVVVGRDVDGETADGGFQEGTVEINGSSPLLFNGVATLNAYGFDLVGQDLNSPPLNVPDVPVSGSADNIDTLELTPYADASPLGWGIDVNFNEGVPTGDDGAQQDLLILHTSFFGGPVSEDIVITPTDLEAGQVVVRNNSDNSIIVDITYVNNLDIIVLDDDGFTTDTDTLTLLGTDTSNPNTSGNDTIDADFTNAGTVAEPLVTVADTDTSGLLYRVRDIIGFNSITFDLLSGDDVLNVVGRVDGSMTIDAEMGTGSDTIAFDVTTSNDAFNFLPGSTDGGGIVNYSQAGAVSSTLNYTDPEQLAVDILGLASASGDGGSDTIAVNGTSSADTFTVTTVAADSDASTIQLNTRVPITSNGLGPTSQFLLPGFDGADSYSANQNGAFEPSFLIDAGTGIDAILVNSSNGQDTFSYTPSDTNDALLDLTIGSTTTNYTLTDLETAAIDGLGGGDSVSFNGGAATDEEFSYLPGNAADSGQITATANGTSLLPLTFENLGDATGDDPQITVNGQGGADTLNYVGTTEADTLALMFLSDNETSFINATSTLTRVPFSAVDVATYLIDTLEGNDQITADGTGATVLTTLNLEGGDGSDSLTWNAPNATIGMVTVNVETVFLNADINTPNLTGTASTVDVGSAGSIQDGVDVALPNITINVAAGTFNENVVVNKSGLTINGASSTTTTVDGGGIADVITIQAPDIVLQNLTATNGVSGITSLTGSTNITLTNVRADTNNVFGVSVFTHGGTLTISNSTANNNQDGGLVLAHGALNAFPVSITDSSFNNNDTNGDGFGDGLNFFNVSVLLLNGVTATGNAIGVSVTEADFLGDTNGTYSNNQDGGIVLDSLFGDVILTGTILEDNDANGDGVGNGLTAGLFPGNVAIDGFLGIQGTVIRDSDGPGSNSHQVNGIFVDGIIGNVILGDTAGPTLSITGHDANGVEIRNQVGGSGITINNVNFENNDSDGIELVGVGTVELGNVTATTNTDHGLSVNGSGSVTLTNAVFTGNTDGINLTDVGGNVTLDEVTTTNNLDDGLSVLGTSPGFFDPTSVILNSTFSSEGNQGQGLEILDAVLIVFNSPSIVGNAQRGLIQNVDTVQVNGTKGDDSVEVGATLSLRFDGVDQDVIDLEPTTFGPAVNQVMINLMEGNVNSAVPTSLTLAAIVSAALARGGVLTQAEATQIFEDMQGAEDLLFIVDEGDGNNPAANGGVLGVSTTSELHFAHKGTFGTVAQTLSGYVIDDSVSNLAQEYGFRPSPSFYLNSYGFHEKWFLDRMGYWYSITPDGTIYQWEGVSRSLGTPVATTYSAIYANPSLLFEGSLMMTRTEEPGPTLEPIEDQVSSHNLPLTISLEGNSRPGRTVTYSAEVQGYDVLRELDQAKQFRRFKSYYTNYLGYNERWIWSDIDGWYVILPDGGLYRSAKNVLSPKLANVGPETWANPELLHNAPEPAAPNVVVDISGNGLTLTPQQGTVGTFRVTATITDGPTSTSQSFLVTTTNTAPEFLVELPDITQFHNDGMVAVPLLAVDTDLDEIEFDVVVRGWDELHEWNSRLGLMQLGGSYYKNYLGRNEKWIWSQAEERWYVLLGNGEFHPVTGHTLKPKVANFGHEVWVNPKLLHEAPAPSVPSVEAMITGDVLLLDVPAEFLGTWLVEVTVNDGLASTSQNFKITTTNLTPEVLSSLPDLTLSQGDFPLELDVDSKDDDGDNLTYEVEVAQVGAAYVLDQEKEFGLLGGSYYTDHLGLSEKWIRSFAENQWYVLVPNGDLYRSDGYTLDETPIASLGSEVWDDPTQLHEASKSPAPASVFASVSAGQLTIDLAEAYQGILEVTVHVGDGVSTTTRSFYLTVI